MTILDGPGCAADQRVIEIIRLRLLDEPLACVAFKRWDAPLLDGLGAILEPGQKVFDIELSHLHPPGDPDDRLAGVLRGGYAREG